MTEQAGRWQADLTAALKDAEVELARLGLPRGLHRAATATISRARKATRNEALDSVVQLRSELAALDGLLMDLYESGIAAEQAEADDRPYGDAWLSRLGRRLSAAEPDSAWREQVYEAWSSAIAANEWETAEGVVRLTLSRPDVGVPVDEMMALGTEFAAGRWENGIRVIDKLVGHAGVSVATQVRLLVAKTRLCLFYVRNPDAALLAAQEAADLAAHGPRRSKDLARAAMVELLLASPEPADADRLVEGVLDRPTGVPDLLVAAGNLRERLGDQAEAEDLYDAAVLRFGDAATSGSLFARLPATLLYRAALISWPEDPDRVLALLHRSLELAEADATTRPEDQPWVSCALILEQLGRRKDAAATYHAAARRYDKAGLPALDLFAKAYELEPGKRRYGWSYAEALRITVTSGAGPTDVDALEHARQVMNGALEGVDLDQDHAWVLVTAAMIARELGDPASIVLAERSILLDPGYARGYAFLSLVLRDHGLTTAAVEAADGGLSVDSADPFVAAQRAQAHAAAGDPRGALVGLEEYLSYFQQSAEVVLAKACIELWQGRPEVALATLDTYHFHGSGWEAALRGQALALLDADKEEREFYLNLLDSAADETSGLSEWMAYRLGWFDQALDRLKLDRRSSKDLPVAMLDRGQVLIARGLEGDINAGRQLLLDGIAVCSNVEQLLQLLSPELPVLNRLVSKRSDATALNVLREARKAALQRTEDLRASRIAPGSTEEALAEAREGVRAGRLEDALSKYLALAGRGELPEAASRVRSLGQDLIDSGDLLLEENPALAVSRWRAVDRVPREGDGLGKLHRQTDVRLALVELSAQSGPVTDTLERLARCRATDLVSVVPRFTTTPRSLTRVLHDLASVAGQAAMPWSEQMPELERVAYAAVLDTGRDRAQGHPGARHMGAVEIGLGRDLIHLRDGDMLKEPMERLRHQLSEQTGVQIPGVKVGLDVAVAPTTARFRVYGRHAGDYFDPSSDRDGTEGLMAAFEDVLRHNLHRWLTIDDLFLWCTVWQPSAGSDDEVALDLLPSTPWGKLQLTRLLKMLLREGLSVRDRNTILMAFSDGQATGTDPREVFEDLRVQLGPRRAGDAEVRLPSALEARVQAGFSGTARTWSMPRQEAGELVADLKAMLGGSRTGPVCVIVSSRQVRSYVWRLLAALRPRVRTVVEGEST